MNMKIRKTGLLAGIVACSSTGVFAIEPEPIQLGGLDLIPTLKVDVSRSDNMFRANTNEVDSDLYLITPRLEAIIDDGRNVFSVAGEVIDGDYSATSEDDYTDWRLDANAHLEMDIRNSFDFNAGLFSTREMRGTGFSQGGFLPTDPDSYEETVYGASYQYGTDSSFGRLVLGVDALDKTYDNNRLTTRFRDREDENFVGTFYLNISPRTDILFEYSGSDVDYTTDPNVVAGAADTLDSDETYAFVGLTWEATAKTTGTIKVGSGEKEFADADRLDADMASWDVSLQWEPLTYSIINISAASRFDEATGVGDALETTNYSLNWQHTWSDSLSSSINIYSSDDEYIGSTRNDELDTLTFRLDYSARRWLDFYVSVARDERQSNFATFEYKENVVALGFSLSL